MAFQKSLFSSLRSTGVSGEASGTPLSLLPRRGYHTELGAREKALLEEDPALRRFKSYKNSVKRAAKIGDALLILVAAACSYELYAATKGKDQMGH